MQNKLIIAAVGVIILGISIFFALKLQRTLTHNIPAKQIETGSEVMRDDLTMKNSNNSSMESSKYIEYSTSALDQAASGKRVLFFYASWCPTCKPADANFKANSEKIPDGLTLIRVNYNDPETDAQEKSLAQKYGVTYQHTFVQIDSSGEVLTKWNGGQIAELLKNVK